MTAVAISPVPEYRDQRWLVTAAQTLRHAVRAFHGGNVAEFLLALKRASFVCGLNEARTPSERRVMTAITRVACAAGERLRIVDGGRS